MRWLEISVRVDGEAAEAVAGVFEQFGEGGAVFETLVCPDDSPSPGEPIVSVKTYVPANAKDLDRRQQIEEALWHLSQLYPIPEPEIRELTTEDWAEAWKKGYGIQHIGRRLVIVPSWENYEPAHNEVVLRLDPGMAFGTGLHPTTRLCLVALEAHLAVGDVVLDIGTGSGILAIAAAKLGAAHVTGLDVDSTAVAVARANVALNDVSDRVTIYEGTLDDLHAVSYNWKLALINILADVIVSLAPTLARHLVPAGTLIASGIVEDYADAVAYALENAGFAVVERRQDKDWVALIAARR